MQLFLTTFILIALAIVGIAIKMFVKKNGEFKKQCATIEFETGEKIGCTCNSERHEDCQYYELHHGKHTVASQIKTDLNA